MERVRSKDGTTIAYDRAGDGPPVVLVDGALNSRAFGLNGPLATPSPTPSSGRSTTWKRSLMRAAAGPLSMGSPQVPHWRSKRRARCPPR